VPLAAALLAPLTVGACWSSSAPAAGPAAPTATVAAAADLGFVLAPQRRGGAALAALAVPIERAQRLLETLSPDDRSGDSEMAGDDGDDSPRVTAYDLDRNGTVDLVAIPRVMYGPSNGWVVYAANGGELELVFSISGGWADARVEAGAVSLRFEANLLAPGEARFSTMLRFANGRWDRPVKSYVAAQGKVPAARPPYARFSTKGPATLRATPAIRDEPQSDEASNYEQTSTLRGNVLAIYAAGARGLVLASQGDWHYVGFDPATRPKETSLSHGMDPEEVATDVETYADREAPTQQVSSAWLCGWVRAAELSVAAAR
jgi:hypothetical protein